VAEARIETPLAGLAQALAAAAPALRARETPFLEVVNLRGDAGMAAFASVVERAIAVVPPAAPNTVARGRTHDALWLGPDEWLLVSHEPRPPALAEGLQRSLERQFASAVDVSSSYAVLELSGDLGRDVLQKGCPLDLHPRRFAAGQCAQSHYFKAGILLRPLGSDAYQVFFARSYADYAVRIMLAAAGL
jgi:sarcosine oxidase, subunit gamma